MCHASHHFRCGLTDCTKSRIVYYISNTNNKIMELSAGSNQTVWDINTFSDRYTASNSSFLTAHWNQNIKNGSTELIILFQQEGITQARYTVHDSVKGPWISNFFGLPQASGSAFAVCPVSYDIGRQLMLYTVRDSKELQQHRYTVSDSSMPSTDDVPLTSASGK